MNQPKLVKDQPKRPGPSTPTLLARGATMACPACGQRKGLFRRWTKMADACPNCGLVFGRFEGQWIGAIGINSIVSFGLLMIFVVVSLALSYPNPDARSLIILSVIVAIVLPVLLFPFSRTFWMGMDLMMTPLTPDEVDWTKVDPAIAADMERAARSSNTAPNDPAPTDSSGVTPKADT